MIVENRTYVQGGTIAERIRKCDVCGSVISDKAYGWAYVQEVYPQSVAAKRKAEGKEDEYRHICCTCWDVLKYKMEYMGPDSETEPPSENMKAAKDDVSEHRLSSREDRRKNRGRRQHDQHHD